MSIVPAFHKVWLHDICVCKADPVTALIEAALASQYHHPLHGSHEGDEPLEALLITWFVECYSLLP